MSNDFIKAIYDLKSINNEDALTTYEERKIREMINKNNNIGRQNIEIFAENEVNFFTCNQYEPCPICRKCLNKSSHLYVKCQNCNIPICSHTHKVKDKMIKRKNFIINISKKDFEKISNEISKTGK